MFEYYSDIFKYEYCSKQTVNINFKCKKKKKKNGKWIKIITMEN